MIYALVGFLQATLLPEMRPREAVGLIKDMGIPITTRGFGNLATIDFTGRKIVVGFETRMAKGKDAAEVVSKIDLHYSYRPKQRVSPYYLQRLTSQWVAGSTIGAAWVGLDGTISLRAIIHLSEGITKEELRRNIYTFISEMGSLQTVMPPGPLDAKPFPVDENLRVDALSSEDLDYLVEQWGWRRAGGMAGSFMYHPILATIDDVFVIMANFYAGREDFSKVMLRVDGARVPEGAKPREFSSYLKKKLHPIEVADFGSQLGFNLTLDLTDGVRLGDLKAKVKRFIKQVSPYAKGWQR